MVLAGSSQPLSSRPRPAGAAPRGSASYRRRSKFTERSAGRPFLRKEFPATKNFPRSNQHQGRQAGQVQQIALIARLSKTCTVGRDRDELDGAETITPMNLEYRHQKGQLLAAVLTHGRTTPISTARPPPTPVRIVSHAIRWGRAHSTHAGGGERLRALDQLGVAVFHEAAANNQAQRHRGPLRRFQNDPA